MLLRAGPLSALFDPKTVFLRYVRLGRLEVLRNIHVAVRDQNWGTVTPKIASLRTDTSARSFQLDLEVDCIQPPVNFHWRGNIIGTRNGTIRFCFSGIARSNFLRNRIGLAALHPIRECAGVFCLITKSDGSQEQARFPFYVSPNEPFPDVRAISYELGSGLMAHVEFEGEVFETEDQRNWGDGSFKTYCTPLRLPFPVEVKSGTIVEQSFRLSLQGKVPRVSSKPTTGSVKLDFHAVPTTSLPRLGLGTAVSRSLLSPAEIAGLRALHLSHLRVDLMLSDPHYQAHFQLRAAEARSLGLTLETVLFLGDDAESELFELSRLLPSLKPPVWRWLVFRRGDDVTGEETARSARRILKQYDPSAIVGGGTNQYFAELNRNPASVHALDFLAFPVTPQAHASDNETIIENLEALPGMVATAGRLSQGLPIAITPVTLQDRYVQPGADPRQRSLFGAAWTLCAYGNLAASGVESITCCETAELQTAGSVFPVYHVLADLCEFYGGGISMAASTEPLQVQGFALNRRNTNCVLIANLSATVRIVRVRLPAAREWVRIRRLDETCSDAAIRTPETFRTQTEVRRAQRRKNHIELDLLPYAVIRLDCLSNSSSPDGN